MKRFSIFYIRRVGFAVTCLNLEVTVLTEAQNFEWSVHRHQLDFPRHLLEMSVNVAFREGDHLAL